MRPTKLTPLFANIATLPKIGPKTGRALSHLLGVAEEDREARVVDLFWHLPIRLIDRRSRPKISEAIEGNIVTLDVTVATHTPNRDRKLPYKVHVFDDSDELTLVFFHTSSRYLSQLLPEGARRIVSGKIEIFSGEFQMIHPDYILKPEELAGLPLIDPVYRLNYGTSNKVVIGAIHSALSRLAKINEWYSDNFKNERGWPDFNSALACIHSPENMGALEPNAPARARLAFDELYANQIALALLRRHRRRRAGRAIVSTGTAMEQATAVLGFKLTSAQKQALDEISDDISKPDQMMRLLQGDVGSGKTAVAALAMVSVCDTGAQSALMVPTEILARQHIKTLKPLFLAIGLKIEILTGREKGAARDKILKQLRDGDLKAIVGTHALFQSDVEFYDLALTIIDEQQRFGVHQRLALLSKAKTAAPDVLIMTATPIPRTLVLTHYGNMDLSRIDELPPGRGNVVTRAVSTDRLNEVINRLAMSLDNGGLAYWICPQIDENGEDRGAAAVARHAELTLKLKHPVVLAHGRQSTTERTEAMDSFRDGRAKVLVATTVVEVGVDIPGATIMVIEQAERFGLSQLHQLRGRIGRGRHDAACLLLYEQPLGDIASRRLEIMRDTNDGFKIAEADLTLRGGGEILGTRQSGLPEFRVVDTAHHTPFIEQAHQMAEQTLSENPRLTGSQGKAVRTLLYLFERDDAIKLAESG
jgi:ATP-dependent DNA helicase RecG